jgi:hypothetical protein
MQAKLSYRKDNYSIRILMDGLDTPRPSVLKNTGIVARIVKIPRAGRAIF